MIGLHIVMKLLENYEAVVNEGCEKTNHNKGEKREIIV